MRNFNKGHKNCPLYLLKLFILYTRVCFFPINFRDSIEKRRAHCQLVLFKTGKRLFCSYPLEEITIINFRFEISSLRISILPNVPYYSRILIKVRKIYRLLSVSNIDCECLYRVKDLIPDLARTMTTANSTNRTAFKLTN